MRLIEATGLLLMEHPGHPDQSVHAGGAADGGAVRARLREVLKGPDFARHRPTAEHIKALGPGDRVTVRTRNNAGTRLWSHKGVVQRVDPGGQSLTIARRTGGITVALDSIEGLTLHEALLLEHPGHSNQKVHNPHKHGQMSLGLVKNPRRGGADSTTAPVRNGAFDEYQRTGTLRLYDSPEEIAMATGSIESVEINGGGVTESFCVYTDPGGKTYAKPIEGLDTTELRDSIPVGEEQEREVAGYLVSKALGDIVPVAPAVLRQGIPGVQGSTPGTYDDFTTTEESRWVLNAPAKGTPEWNALSSQERAARLAMFDNVIGNTDRHGNNYSIDENGNLLPIDHSLAFPTFDGQVGQRNWIARQYPLDSTMRQSLERLVGDETYIRGTLRQIGLGDDAIDGVFARSRVMLARGSTLDTDDWGLSDPFDFGDGSGDDWKTWESRYSSSGTAPVRSPRTYGGGSTFGGSTFGDGAFQTRSPHSTGRTSVTSSYVTGTTSRAGRGGSVDRTASLRYSQIGRPLPAQSPHPRGYTSAFSSNVSGWTTKGSDDISRTLQSPHRFGWMVAGASPQTSILSSEIPGTTRHNPIIEVW